MSRKDLLVSEVDPRRLDSFTRPPAIEWFDPFRYYGQERTSLEAKMLATTKWRYHHHIPALVEEGDLYKAYIRRVDALLAMCDSAIDAVGTKKDLSEMSVVDLGCAEGFVAAHMIRRGIASIDCFELSLGNIDRFSLTAAWHNLGRGDLSESASTPTGSVGSEGPRIRLGRLDLENVEWCRAVGVYDLVLALGVVYHMENIALFCRNLYEITADICLVESDTPIFQDAPRFRGNGVVYLHRDQVTLESGNVRYLTEMRPDSRALAQLLLSVGFSRVALVPPSEKPRYDQFDSGEKSLFVCTKD